MKTSIITLTATNVKKKGFCIKHCIQSILNQKNVNFKDLEMVIVENSRDKDPKYVEELKAYLDTIKSEMQIKVVECEKFSSRGDGRNFGVKNSTGDLLIFIDEDTFIYSEDGLEQLFEAAKISDYGYGANRYWTKPEGWFEENSDKILEQMKNHEDPFLNNISYAPENVRGSSDTKLQNVSFISNFGYCFRDKFDKVGGYPDFPGRDLEDDFLTFKLFKNGFKYQILYTVSVIHVTHPFVEGEFSNIALYFEMMKKMGYFWFNISKTFEEINPLREEVLQPLGLIHPDYRLQEAFEIYNTLIPANIDQKNEIDLKIWKQMNKYNLQDYLITCKTLLDSNTLDDFVRHSKSDFDNLIPVIKSCIQSNIVEIETDGKIVDKIHFKYFPSKNLEDLSVVYDPKNEYNQFPCDIECRKTRVTLLRERYPLTDYLRIAILGDDDLVSSEIAKEEWIEANVFEIDPNVISHFSPNWTNIKVKSQDLRTKEFEVKSHLDTVNSFLIDPPYTLNGILLFIYKGLQMLKKDDSVYEFYVVLNQTMVGLYLKDVEKILSDANVWIHETVNNFSQYTLPENFEERKRANEFLKEINVDIKALKYSSSSNLYIMRTNKPNLRKLWSKIDLDKVYNHFI